jgi:glycosyltransferase involved in cell wall biosynthesis
LEWSKGENTIAERQSVSVALAAYNGERFITEQIESILSQLKSGDELIISDNGSTDGTIKIIQEKFLQDPRVGLLFCKEKGVIANLNNALAACKNEIVFFSDQDDVWLPDKVETILKAFQTHPDKDLVMSDIIVTDEQLHEEISSFFAYRGTRLGVCKNIFKNTFIGCAMAFRRSFLVKYLPIPTGVPMHDMWLGILANREGKALLIPEKLILYRRHGQTVTTVSNSSTLLQKIKWRFSIIYYVFFYSPKSS